MVSHSKLLEAARLVDVSGVSIGDKAILMALLELAEDLVAKSSTTCKVLTFKYTGEGDFYGWGFYDEEGNEFDVPGGSTLIYKEADNGDS